MKVNVTDFTESFEVIDELFCGHPPVADFIVDINFGRIVIAGLHPEPRITFYAGFRTVDRPAL